MSKQLDEMNPNALKNVRKVIAEEMRYLLIMMTEHPEDYFLDEAVVYPYETMDIDEFRNSSWLYEVISQAMQEEIVALGNQMENF